MTMVDTNLKRTIAKIAAALQICIGVLLLVGTIWLTLTAYRTVQNESKRLAGNFKASAEAFESMRSAYEQSASNMFQLTSTMDDVAEKLGEAAEVVSGTGRRIASYGSDEESSLWDKIKPFKNWAKNSGARLTEVGGDVESVSSALKGQSATIQTYRADGHEKTLGAITKATESLRHAEDVFDNGRSARLWCGFVCILGFCVSMLFFANGTLLFLFAKIETKMAT